MVQELLDLINHSHSQFHVIKNIKDILDNNGFEKLEENKKWKIENNKKYYVTRNDSSIIAFEVPTDLKGYNIVSSHSDSPTFKIKENPEMKTNDYYVRLNTETYGGLIMSTWFDKPLSFAGRVVYEDGDSYKCELIDYDKNSLIIPSVAIHMNREANNGMKYNPQIDTIPLFTSDPKVSLKDVIKKYLNIDKEILSSDLFLYNRQEGSIWGLNNEFISAGRLDDLECAYSSIKALVDSDLSNNMVCIFDNEEVGSLTKQGADSTLLEDTLKRINESLGGSYEDYLMLVSNSFNISADNAHAIHSNHPELADPINQPVLNKGIVIKYHGGQKYTSDAISAAKFKMLCKKANVPYQEFTNRSDKVGGSTLGNLSNAHVSLSSVDIGLAQLAMHSSYETAGSKDVEYLIKVLKEYFKKS
ncbi:MAG: M18 family aminopeptidase [Thomasclavelia sp.]|jgi:aspartyl aminopeptidase|nr:M18 family aminopeptidase [Thomasclavelia sp.]